MRNIKKLLSLVAFLMIAQSAFAATGDMTTVSTDTVTVSTTSATTSLEMTTPPRLVNKTSTGITLEWDAVNGASSYIVLYGKTSVASSTGTDAEYENETDPINGTGTTITPLEANTKYYIAVLAVDKEGNQSDTSSSELEVSTEAADAVASTTAVFGIANVTPVDNKTITVEFTSAVGVDPVTLKITKTSDNSDVAVSEVVKDQTTPNKVIAKLAGSLDKSSSYSLTVVSAKDDKGNNIAEGVNGMKEFTTPDALTLSPELNSASGETMSGATASGATLTDAKALPATGAKENLIIVAALVLSFGIVYIYRRKLAK